MVKNMGLRLSQKNSFSLLCVSPSLSHCHHMIFLNQRWRFFPHYQAILCDTSYLAQTPQVKGSVPEAALPCPTRRRQLQILDPRLSTTSVHLGYKLRIPMTPPPWIWLFARRASTTQGNIYLHLPVWYKGRW